MSIATGVSDDVQSRVPVLPKRANERLTLAHVPKSVENHQTPQTPHVSLSHQLALSDEEANLLRAQTPGMYPE